MAVCVLLEHVLVVRLRVALSIELIKVLETVEFFDFRVVAQIVTKRLLWLRLLVLAVAALCQRLRAVHFPLCLGLGTLAASLSQSFFILKRRLLLRLLLRRLVFDVQQVLGVDFFGGDVCFSLRLCLIHTGIHACVGIVVGCFGTIVLLRGIHLIIELVPV